jgi:hypothetical protein
VGVDHAARAGTEGAIRRNRRGHLLIVFKLIQPTRPRAGFFFARGAYETTSYPDGEAESYTFLGVFPGFDP